MRTLPSPDEAARKAVLARETQLTKPVGSLGRLEEITAWLSTWQGSSTPTAARVQAIVFAGNHGVAERGVSAYPAAVTAQMVANFNAGGAAVNQLCSLFDVDLRIVPLELSRPTADFVTSPALEEREFADAVTQGGESIDRSADVVCLGEMGIGNTTAAAAICHALYGGAAEMWTGPGTGVSGASRARKQAVVERGVARHRHEAVDGLDVLRRLGGRELAAIAGAIIAAHAHRKPVILDGYVVTAAAATLEVCVPGILDHCIVGHASAEPGHRRVLERLGKEPLLSFGMRLGEASGAVLAIAMLRAACACHGGMATFSQAHVSRNNAD